MDLME
ncbi:hypothetical protein BN873_300103 [Candidatus Competibacter denitrificans Run_A_D11]